MVFELLGPMADTDSPQTLYCKRSETLPLPLFYNNLLVCPFLYAKLRKCVELYNVTLLEQPSNRHFNFFRLERTFFSGPD